MKRVFALLLVAGLLLSFAACSAEQKIVGTWKNQSTALGVVVETSYTFREDGTGVLNTFLVTGVEFTYTVSGDLLTITSNVLGVESEVQYQLTFEGDEMTMTSDGEALVLTKAE